MPRTEKDTRTPDERMTSRYKAGIRMAAEQLLKDVQYVLDRLDDEDLPNVSLVERASRVELGLQSLQTIVDLREDEAALAKILADGLNNGQRRLLIELSRALQGVRDVRRFPVGRGDGPAWRQLIKMGLVLEVLPDNSIAHYFQITDAGRELVGRL